MQLIFFHIKGSHPFIKGHLSPMAALRFRVSRLVGRMDLIHGHDSNTGALRCVVLR